MADDSLLRVARIAAGEFVMGADEGDEDERPRHRAYVDEFALVFTGPSRVRALRARYIHPLLRRTLTLMVS